MLIRLVLTESGCFFGEECWSALAENCCPELKILWIDAVQKGTWNTTRMVGTSFAPPHVVRTALGSDALSGLKLCMINPDKDLESRWGGVGNRRRGGGDRLAGEKMK